MSVPLPAEPGRPAELTDETIVAWARRVRARKGLPPKITDAVTLRRVVVLAFGTGLPSGDQRQQEAAHPMSEGPG